jgi:hypothetical protein
MYVANDPKTQPQGAKLDASIDSIRKSHLKLPLPANTEGAKKQAARYASSNIEISDLTTPVFLVNTNNTPKPMA